MSWMDIIKVRRGSNQIFSIGLRSGIYCTKHKKGGLDTWYECDGCIEDFNKEYPNVKQGVSSKDWIKEEEYDSNNPEHYRDFDEEFHGVFGHTADYYKGDSAKYLNAREEFLAKNPRRWVER